MFDRCLIDVDLWDLASRDASLYPHLNNFTKGYTFDALQWRHNERHGVSNRRCLDCLLNRFFRCISKRTSNLRVTGPCEGNPPATGCSPHKGPVTREMFPFDDVIMWCWKITLDGVFWKTSYSHQATVNGVRLEKGIDINGALLKEQ